MSDLADAVPFTRVSIQSCQSSVDARVGRRVTNEDRSEYQRYIYGNLAQGLVDGLVTRGLIRFVDGPVDECDLTYTSRATLGVVSPVHVATLEERIAEHDAALITAVIGEAIEAIRVWGSRYSGDEGVIYKAQAVDSLRLLLRKRLEAL